MLTKILLAIAIAGLSTQAATAAEILIQDDKSAPESLSVGPDGTVYAGSASSPYVYRVKKGATTAERFVDVSSEGAGTFFLGQLVDAASNTLWTCQLTPNAGATPPTRRSSLRGFDLRTGAPKLRWDLPGAASLCNDFSIGPDKALYITDTANAKIYRLPPGAQAAELFLDNRLLLGIDGIAFLGGAMYVNSVSLNKLFRVPVDAAGKPGALVDIWMDAPVKGPDGMRAAGGKLFVAENASGKVVAMTVTGEMAHVVTVRDGLKQPTGVEPAGDTLWFTERATGKVISVPLPN
jgi:streptogramin lyase